MKTGMAGNNWTVVQASGVSSIALAEGTTPSSGLMGYLSINGSFFASEVSPEVQWTLEARGVAAISLAAVGPTRRTAPRLPGGELLLRSRRPHPGHLGPGGDRCG